MVPPFKQVYVAAVEVPPPLPTPPPGRVVWTVTESGDLEGAR